MPALIFVTSDGIRHEVDVDIGTSVMQGAVDNMISGILAECGGSCSCATCHCYVDADWLDKTGRPGIIESELLTCVADPTPNSRLSCQIIMSGELDGLVVRIPESQL